MTTQSLKTRLNNLTLLYWLLAVGVVLFVVSAFLWWHAIYMNPKNVFNGMIDNNFATTGYTRETKSDQSGLKSQEIAQIQTGGVNTVETRTSLERGDEKVVTEAIGTEKNDFVRYTKIETTQKDSKGKAMDFSEVINVWSKNESGGLGSNFQQLLLGIVPIGNVSPETRGELKKFMHEHTVFAVDYDSVKKETVDGRKVYTYEVQLLPQTYVELLKIYGNAVGLSTQVADLDPKNYADAEPTDLVITVDATSRTLTHIKYPEANREESYSGFGITKPVALPKETITGAELQKRLSPQN